MGFGMDRRGLMIGGAAALLLWFNAAHAETPDMTMGMAALSAYFPPEGRVQMTHDDLNYYDQHGHRIGTAHYDHGKWDFYDQHGHRVGTANTLPDGKLEILDEHGHRIGLINK